MVEPVFLLLVQNWTMEPAQYFSQVKLVFLLLEQELDHGTSSNIFFRSNWSSSGTGPELLEPELGHRTNNIPLEPELDCH